MYKQEPNARQTLYGLKRGFGISDDVQPQQVHSRRFYGDFQGIEQKKKYFFNFFGLRNLLGVKKIQATATQQDLTSQGFFAKFPTNFPVPFINDKLPAYG